jgi:hypothetical protein
MWLVVVDAGARVLGIDSGLRAKATEIRQRQAAMSSTMSERPRPIGLYLPLILAPR